VRYEDSIAQRSKVRRDWETIEKKAVSRGKKKATWVAVSQGKKIKNSMSNSIQAWGLRRNLREKDG